MNLIPASAFARRGTRAAFVCVIALFATMAATAQTRPSADAPQALQVAPAANLQAPDSNALRINPGNKATPPAQLTDSGAAATPNAVSPDPEATDTATPDAASPDTEALDAEAIVRALTGVEPLQPPRSIIRTGYWQANGYWLLPLLVIAVLTIAAIATALYRRSRRPMVLSPQLIALQAIENAATNSEDKRFASAVSDAVRSYLEARFQLRATEQTTEEFLQQAPQSSHLPPAAVEALAHLLQLCDLAKFARQGLTPAQRSDLSETALKLVWSLGQPAEVTATPPGATASAVNTASAEKTQRP